MTTYMANAQTADPKWCLVNANGKTLGRLASEIARRLRGKHKAEFTPHADTGDFIIVINADKIAVTGKKESDKLYYRHSGYSGGLKTMNFGDMQKKRPGLVLEHAVRGMLPKGPLGRKIFTKLKIYAGENHPHQAQLPELVEL